MKKFTFILLLFLCLLFTSVTTINAEKNDLEVFNWLIGDGEKKALESVIKLFNDKNPEIKVINATIAGGAGANAKTILKSRLENGNPPDTFQVRGGAELINTYVKEEKIKPLTGLIEKWDVKNKFHPDILKMCSYKGEIYSIPLSIHRGNVLWYNKSLLKKYNIQPPSTIAELLTAMNNLKIKGITPLALGNKNKWEATHLFETIMLAELGGIGYNNLWNGSANFNKAALKNTLTTFKNILYYINEDHAVLTWQEACHKVYEGQAAFTIMGDWAESYFKQINWTPGDDFGWIPMPGTNDFFMIITDYFALAKQAPNPDAASKWLKFIASSEVQDTFNPIKGSIPGRIDTDKNLYDPYLCSTIQDFTETKLTPSIIHGSAAPDEFVIDLNNIINEFIVEKNVDKALNSIIEAEDKHLQ